MDEILNIDKLDEKIQKTVRDYCEKFINLHGQSLKSLFIYGSAAGGEFIHKKSNVNLLAVFGEIGLPELKKSLKLVYEGRKKGIVAPLMTTAEHIRRSTDSFPLEFLEMKDRYILLFGEDVLKDLGIGHNNLRLQCEQQIKGGLIRLYQSFLEIGHKDGEVLALIANSLKSFMPAFRGLLRIRNKAVPAEWEEVVKSLCKEFSLKEQVFIDALEIRKGKLTGDAEIAFGRYIEEIEKLAIETDRMS